MAAGRPFHCGCASIARAPLSSALEVVLVTSDIRTKSTKTALHHQTFWCVALLLTSGSWLYQGYINRALIAFAATTFYFAISVTNYKDRKSTRLNSSHVRISYAVFCL